MRHDDAVWMVRVPPSAGPQSNQPLGYMYLASALRRQGFWNVRIVDVAPQRLTTEDVVRAIARERPPVVFLTADTVDMGLIGSFSAAVALGSPATRMVIGGAHPTADPASCLREAPHVHIAVAGEGEATAVELMEALEPDGPGDLDRVRGIAFRREDGEIQSTPARASGASLDDDLWPAYDLIDIPAYFTYQRMGVLFRHPEYMSLFTSRGCKYNCRYCHNVFGPKYRQYSSARILDEMEFLARKHGIREFQIVDDLFNGDSNTTQAVCEGILRRDLRVALCFPNGLRADRLSDDDVRSLHRAGTWRMCVAIETASERLQRMIGKHNDLGHVRHVIEIAASLGIFTSGFFMLGFPSETRAELEQTVRWALDSDLHSAAFFRVLPLPGSLLREDLAGERLAGLGNDAYEAMGTSINLSAIPDADMEALHRDAIRRFYRRPRQLARLARVMPKHPRLWPAYAYEFATRLVVGTHGPHLASKLGAPGGWARGWKWLQSGKAYD